MKQKPEGEYQINVFVSCIYGKKHHPLEKRKIATYMPWYFSMNH